MHILEVSVVGDLIFTRQVVTLPSEVMWTFQRVEGRPSHVSHDPPRTWDSEA